MMADDVGLTSPFVCRDCGVNHPPSQNHVYTYVGPSDPHLECPVCGDPFVNPVVTPCRHTFCRNCLESALMEREACPLDHSNVRLHQLRPVPVILAGMLDKLPVVCPLQCGEDVERGHLAGHLAHRCPTKRRSGRPGNLLYQEQLLQRYGIGRPRGGVSQYKNPDMTDYRKYPALHVAARAGSKNAVEAIVAAGADPNARNCAALTFMDNWTPLQWAVYGGHEAVVESLLRMGARVDARVRSADTSLAAADYFNYSDAAPRIERMLRHNAYGAPP